MKTNIFELWPVPILKGNIGIDQTIVNFCDNIEYKKSSVGYTSKNMKVLDSLKDVKDSIKNELHLYLKEYMKVNDDLDFRFEQSWIYKLQNGERVGPHMHENSLISGVYYIKLPNDKDTLNFVKSPLYNNVFNPTIKVGYKESNKVNIDSFNLDVAPGDLVLFPSHLLHQTLNSTSSLRYSLSFNIFPRGKINGDLYEIKI